MELKVAQRGVEPFPLFFSLLRRLPALDVVRPFILRYSCYKFPSLSIQTTARSPLISPPLLLSPKMSMNGRRPQNPPPADAFTNYRPTAPPSAPSTSSSGPPQRNNSAGSAGATGGAPLREPGPRDGAPREGGERPGGSSKPAPLTLEQSRAVARTHYGALKGWLTKEGALTSASTRTCVDLSLLLLLSPERTHSFTPLTPLPLAPLRLFLLTRLTRQQFQELSTDVYDELMRRLEDGSGRPGERALLALLSPFPPSTHLLRFPPTYRAFPPCPLRFPPETQSSPPKTRDSPYPPLP
jgi:hypothetical protein